MLIAENIARIEDRIQKACISAGRKRDEITLMAVTKFEPVGKIEEAYGCGIRCFGESRVKEASEKFDGFKGNHQDAKLHMIGSLQRNKVKQAVSLFDCIQSVDRNELIAELEKHPGLCKSVLFELHTGEDTKSGFLNTDALLKAAELALNTGNIKPAGLMTMAPFTEDAKLIRSSFRQLVKAGRELEKRFPAAEGKCRWDVLSMGMSNDFEIAIEEGSTLLRIGSAVFK
ncbi:MAG: YggS family pyridoxal phosphate-dependent enzyme [Treponema sp.]|jgi:pyridoxal phosphate enzyme (YggS family)|nr:YggS family pyridoxal phosphate-dependent enzyme [Treponema sp.]